MKKIIAFVLSLCIVGGSAPAALEYAADCAITANAAEIVDSGTCGDDLTWTLDAEGTLTISGTGDMTDYASDESPFCYNKAIKNVVIENGVTSIGDAVFWCCRNIESVTIPDYVTDIGGGAFSGTAWLKNKQEEDPLVIVNGILIDGETCVGDVIIPDSVTSIGDGAFANCTSLTSVTIPNSVTSIDDDAFYYCESLESITIPDSVVSVGELAFYRCTSLTSITIPDSVTSIGNGAFGDCTSLRSIAISGSVTSIGGATFSWCISLGSVTIPDSVTSIGNRAFDVCTSLTSITILDPECEICDEPFTICSDYNYDSETKITEYYFNGTILGYVNSTAQAYAEKYGRKFLPLAPDGRILGDVNGDSSLDSSDAAMILQHYAAYQSDGKGSFTAAQLEVADFNNDNNIDSSDSALILKTYAENQSK